MAGRRTMDDEHLQELVSELVDNIRGLLDSAGEETRKLTLQQIFDYYHEAM